MRRASTRKAARVLQGVMPAAVKDLFPQSLKDAALGTQSGMPKVRVYDELYGLMNRYDTRNLVNATPAEFESTLRGFLDLDDAEMEGFDDPAFQRDLSIKFHWGHDQDFGSFSLDGHLGNRHVTLVAGVVEWLQALPRDLTGFSVLDIGCWSGGTSLLLYAMGANVVAVEEVKKYMDALDYIRHAFDLDGFEPRSLSLYECTGPEFEQRFDVVLFAGVLYHLTDLLVGLRIIFNALKDGGTCILETAVTDSDERILTYEGPMVISGGSLEERNRSGWNWFFPSPSTLRQMLLDVGFDDVQLTKVIASSAGPRIFATARRTRHRDILRAGLSVRDIR